MAAELRRRLPDWADITWLPTTGSTNTDLLAEARGGLAQPRLRGTHTQEQGRGRANRNFRTLAGQALLFSCGFQTELPVAALPTLSVFFGLLACESLAAQLDANHELCLKWPNDLQLGDAKLAGLLMETATAPDIGNRVVIGMGINLAAAAALSTTLDRPIADWSQSRCATPLPELCATVAQAWMMGLRHMETHWQAATGLPDLPARYARHDALAGRPLSVRDHDTILKQGLAQGVNAHGALLLRSELGLEPVYAGDISVRAL